MGAVIAKGNKVLSSGFNVRKTHPTYGTGYYRHLHAEGNAIYKAVRKRIDLQGSTIYVYRNNGRLAKPCLHCQELIERFGISEIVYSAEQA